MILAGGETFAIPQGQDGTSLTAQDLVPGTVNKGDSWSMVDVLPMQRRHSLFAAGRQSLVTDIDLYAQALFSSRDVSRRSRTADTDPRTVPAANPYSEDPAATHAPANVFSDPAAYWRLDRRTGPAEAPAAPQ